MARPAPGYMGLVESGLRGFPPTRCSFVCAADSSTAAKAMPAIAPAPDCTQVEEAQVYGPDLPGNARGAPWRQRGSRPSLYMSACRTANATIAVTTGGTTRTLPFGSHLVLSTSFIHDPGLGSPRGEYPPQCHFLANRGGRTYPKTEGSSSSFYIAIIP